MRKHPPLVRRRLVPGIGLVVAATVGGAVAVAGCGNSQAQVTLPKKSGHMRLARIAPAAPSQRQLVVTAYEGYWQATNQAIDSRDPAAAKSILTSYVPGSVISGLITGMKVLWRRDEMAYGAPVFHIVAVK